MSILIRGMEMPENCDKCRFQSALRLYCDAMPYNYCGNTDDIERPEWCPLIEIPQHGDLIDRDELRKIFLEQYDYLQMLDWDENPTAKDKQTGVNWCINTMTDDAEVVIPAESEEE